MFNTILSLAFALFFALALIACGWGLTLYILSVGSSEHGRKESKAILIAGTTSLFILMVVFSVIQWLGGLVGLHLFQLQ